MTIHNQDQQEAAEPAVAEETSQEQVEETKKEPSRAEKRIQELANKARLAEEEANTLRAKIEERERQELEKQGEYQRLYTEAQEKQNALSKELEELRAKTEKYNEAFRLRNEEELKKIPESKKEVIMELLAGKSEEEKAAILPKLVQEFSPKGFGAEISSNQKAPNINQKKDRFNQLKELAAKNKGHLPHFERMEMLRIAEEIKKEGQNN